MQLKRDVWIHVISIITVLYYAYYAVWRLTTFNLDAIFFSVLFFLAEIQGMFNYSMFLFMTWNIKEEIPNSTLEDIKVDVFIPTYNEDLDILEATLIGCKNMTYPHTTYVLDDGHRSTVRALANRLGCEYISRPNNLHAKAGNINHALALTTGEFIAIFDADTVPQPDFLEKTLGYFLEEKVAVVQLPQEFFNLDSIQHARESELWHEQQLFYRVIQPGKNNVGAPFWCGSPSIVRRTALEDINGVATQSVTEDLHTTIRLNAKGWVVKYHNEVLAYGIAPQTFEAFSTQRLRWAQGAMQIFFSRENPLVIPGLNWRQRISHFASMWTYFDAYQKIIFLLVPSWYLLTHQMPMSVSPISFILHWIPYFALGMIANMVLGRGYYRYFYIERYNILKIFTFVRATITLGINKKLKFKVTPKTVESSVKKIDMIRVIPVICCVIFSVSSLVLGSINFLFNLSNLKLLAAILWSSYNVVLFGLSALSVIRRKYLRAQYRFMVKSNGYAMLLGKPTPIVISDLSTHGVGFYIPNDGELPSQLQIQINSSPQIILDARIVYVSKENNGYIKIGATIINETDYVRESLMRYLFVTAPRIHEFGYDDKAIAEAAAAIE